MAWCFVFWLVMLGLSLCAAIILIVVGALYAQWEMIGGALCAAGALLFGVFALVLESPGERGEN